MLAKEELWKHPGFPGMIVVTTNATIAKRGNLVMGRGAAKQAVDRIKNIQFEAGTIARTYIPVGSSTGFAQYGFAIVRHPTEDKIGFGIFQVKWHFAENACLDMIEMATDRLLEYIEEHPDVNIRMNFPGIGAGRLSPDDVLPIIERLETVTICHKGI